GGDDSQSLGTAADIGDDLDAVLDLQQFAQAAAHEDLVVNQQHAHAHRRRTGRSARSSKPPAGALPATSTPPAASARWPSDDSPNPLIRSRAPRPSSPTHRHTRSSLNDSTAAARRAP